MNVSAEKQLLAFHSDPAIKQKYLDRVKAHRLAGEIVKEYTWDNDTGTGCAMGCTIHGNRSGAYEEELGIPGQLVFLKSVIHPGISNERAEFWAEQFLAAITPGDDLSLVAEHFVHWLLADPAGVRTTFKACDFPGKCCFGEFLIVDEVADLYARRISGDEPVREEWDKACRQAIDSVAFAKQQKGTPRTAGCLAWTAVLAADDPKRMWDVLAWAAEPDSAETWERMADKLLSLFEAAKPGELVGANEREDAVLA